MKIYGVQEPVQFFVVEYFGKFYEMVTIIRRPRSQKTYLPMGYFLAERFKVEKF